MKLFVYLGKYIFAQIIEFIPRREFDKFVKQYAGDLRIRNLDCRDQFLALVFGQLTNLRSLRGIVSHFYLKFFPKFLHPGFWQGA